MNAQSAHRTSRRAFLAKGAAAGALTIGGGRLLIETPAALAGESLPAGDAAILRFLAAAELLEADLWQQYNELGGIQDSEVPRRQRESGVHTGARGPRRGHGPVHP